MKILAFGASSSRKSINRTLATYAASLVAGAQIETLDLNDYEIPLYSEDREAELGQPEKARAFLDKLGAADAIVVSFAEHNGSYTAAYKNLFDWSSRVQRDVFQHKPVVFLATSPGPGGAASVLKFATDSAHFFAAEVKGSLSIPSFYDHFDLQAGELTEPELKSRLLDAMSTLTPHDTGVRPPQGGKDAKRSSASP